MSPYSRGRLARRMGMPLLPLPSLSLWSRSGADYLHGWEDEDDTLRTGVDSIQQAYVADLLDARRAADENGFREWVRSQRVAG